MNTKKIIKINNYNILYIGIKQDFETKSQYPVRFL